MFQFTSSQTISQRVYTVVNATIELRGEAWLLGLGYQHCNDYAQSVLDQISLVTTTSGQPYKEFIRFETVARCIRTYKARIRSKQAIK